MQTYQFKPELEKIKDGEIYTAESGKGYVKNSELHITENDYHFVYKFDENGKGWYMRNTETNEDVFLDNGASPTAEYETVEIKNQTSWDKIIQPTGITTRCSLLNICTRHIKTAAKVWAGKPALNDTKQTPCLM